MTRASTFDAGTSAAANPLWMLAALALTNFFNFTDRVLFSVLLEPIKQDLMLSDTQMGILGGIAFGLLYGAAGLVMGRLADTRNRVRTISVSLALWSAASAACGYATSFAQMFLARALVGVGVSGCAPCGQSLIADYFPRERRAMALSVFAGVGAMGTIVGLAAGGIIAQVYGWRTAFVLFAVPGLVMAPLLFLFGREPVRGTFDAGPDQRAAWGPSIRLLLARPLVRLLLTGTPLIMVTVGVANWIPAFLQRAHAASPADVGTFGGASLGFGLVMGTLAGGFLVNGLMRRDRRWEFWWPALATAVSVPLLAAFYMASDVRLAYGILFFAFLVAGTSLGPSLACVLGAAEASLRGTMVALSVVTTSLVAYGVAPALIGIISDLLITLGVEEQNGQSLRYALLSVLVFPLAGAAILWRAAFLPAENVTPG